MTNADWITRSQHAVWHPCTQMKRHESFPLLPIARAEGVEDCLFAIDACDWSDAYKDKVYQMVYRVTSDRVTSGCVVQFHINGYHTAEVLDKALDNWINVKGLRPVTVGELMQLSGRDFPPLPDYGD